jgi:hypothetical protein
MSRSFKKEFDQDSRKNVYEKRQTNKRMKRKLKQELLSSKPKRN